MPADLRAQYNYAWAADEAKQAHILQKLAANVCETTKVAAKARLERRPLAAAKNNDQRRLVKVALKHTPDDVCIRFNRRLKVQGRTDNYLAHLWRVTLRRRPLTLLWLLVWLHELGHCNQQRDARLNDQRLIDWHQTAPFIVREAGAEVFAYKIMLDEGLSIPLRGVREFFDCFALWFASRAKDLCG